MHGALLMAPFLSVIAFCIALFCSLVFGTATLNMSLLQAGFVSTLTFLAAIILCSRDFIRYTAAMKTVRKRLLDRDDVEESEFLKELQKEDHATLLQVREAIAEVFDVPASKIKREDNLKADYQCESLGIDFNKNGFHEC